MTYQEQVGAPRFDWKKFLKKRDHTFEEFEEAYYASESWKTCAVGHLPISIERDEDIPVDKKLTNLGMKFNISILQWYSASCQGKGRKARKRCRRIHRKINQRAKLLL